MPRGALTFSRFCSPNAGFSQHHSWWPVWAKWLARAGACPVPAAMQTKAKCGHMRPQHPSDPGLSRDSQPQSSAFSNPAAGTWGQTAHLTKSLCGLDRKGPQGSSGFNSSAIDRAAAARWSKCGVGLHWKIGRVMWESSSEDWLGSKYFNYLKMSAVVAKQELKLSIKKGGFSHQLSLQELAGFSCLPWAFELLLTF